MRISAVKVNDPSSNLYEVSLETAEANQYPLHVVWMLDVSGSMDSVMDTMRQSVQHAMSSLGGRAGALHSIICFDHELKAFHQRLQFQEASSVISQLCAQGGTDFNSPLETLRDRLTLKRTQKETRITVFLSDGRHNPSSEFNPAHWFTELNSRDCYTLVYGLSDSSDYRLERLGHRYSYSNTLAGLQDFLISEIKSMTPSKNISLNTPEGRVLVQKVDRFCSGEVFKLYYCNTSKTASHSFSELILTVDGVVYSISSETVDELERCEKIRLDYACHRFADICSAPQLTKSQRITQLQALVDFVQQLADGEDRQCLLQSISSAVSGYSETASPQRQLTSSSGCSRFTSTMTGSRVHQMGHFTDPGARSNELRVHGDSRVGCSAPADNRRHSGGSHDLEEAKEVHECDQFPTYSCYRDDNEEEQVKQQNCCCCPCPSFWRSRKKSSSSEKLLVNSNSCYSTQNKI